MAQKATYTGQPGKIHKVSRRDLSERVRLSLLEKRFVKEAVRRLDIVHKRLWRIFLDEHNIAISTDFELLYLYVTNRKKCRKMCLKNIEIFKKVEDQRLMASVLMFHLIRPTIALLDNDITRHLGLLRLYCYLHDLGSIKFYISLMSLSVYLFAQCELGSASDASSYSHSSLKALLQHIRSVGKWTQEISIPTLVDQLVLCSLYRKIKLRLNRINSLLSCLTVGRLIT